MRTRNIIVVTAAVVLLGMTGCGKTDTKNASSASSSAATAETEVTQTDGQYHNTESLDSAAAETGFSMSAPEMIEGAEVRKVLVSDDDTVINVQYLDNNGSEILAVKKSSRIEDASDSDDVYETEKTIPVNDTPVSFSENGNRAYKASWEKDTFSYTIYADNGMPEGDIMNLIFAID